MIVIRMYTHRTKDECAAEKVEYGKRANLENALPIGSQFPVFLHTLQPPPRGISAVVARVGTTAQEIGNQTMTQAGSKGQQVVTVGV